MNELTKNTCFQYFSGNVSPLQRKMILEWLEENSSNQEIFYQWLAEWESEHVQFMPDENAAAKEILNRLDCVSVDTVTPGEMIFPKQSFWMLKRKWWVAASVLFVMAASLYLFQDNIRYAKYETVYREVKEFNLSDGSHVVLNANSSLLVPRWGFEKGDRDVTLKGEAAFSVIHTKANQRFLVHTDGQFNVEVLGTEFSVYSRNNTNKVELKKGSVKLLFNKQENLNPILMKPGDIASIGTEGKFLLKHQQPANNFIARKDHRFVFDSTSLNDAVNYIQEFFGDKIIIYDDLLMERRITGSFKAESSEEILSILAEMYNMEILEKGDSLILKEKNKTYNK